MKSAPENSPADQVIAPGIDDVIDPGRDHVIDPVIDPGGVAFDIDGVVADTMRLFLRIAETEFGIAGLRYERITNYDLQQCLDIPPDTLKAMVVRLLDDEQTAALEPMPGAAAALARLARRHVPLRFVTARPTPEAIHRWIVGLLPPGTAIDLTATGAFEAKADVLLEKGVTHFVEDRLETCFHLEEAGITPVLYRQPWNRRPHPYAEVGGWKDLSRLLGV